MSERRPVTSSSARRMRLLLALPKLGIVLLLAALLSLLWLLQRNEAEEERSALIKDVLWLEQNMRFHLNGNEEQLQQLAVDLASQSTTDQLFRTRAAHMLKTRPEIASLLWLDGSRRTIDELPSHSQPEQEFESTLPPIAAKYFEIASRLGKPVYSDPYFATSGRAHVALLAPVIRERQLSSMLVAIYPLDSLLGNLVPWWFTEKYRVAIVDGNDIQFATKTNIEGSTSQTYQIPLEPPGYGLQLKVSSYPSPGNSLQRLLTFAIVILGAGVFSSLWMVRDLMRKRSLAEEALRAEHAFRTAMEDSLTVGMRARDLVGCITYVNPAFCKMTGFSSEELVGRLPPMPYWVPEQIEETFAIHRTVLAGNAPADGFELTLRRKNGERFQALIYEARLIDGNGQHTGWMASMLDITERKAAEELARQQQEQLQFTARLVTMGEMASTLAHELNQPLAAIASYNTGCLNLLERPDCRPAEIQPALQKLGVQAQRAGRIIRRVHDFVRKSEPKRAPCNLGEVIEDCLGFVEADARKKHVHIECTLPALPPIPADRLMLEQVLLNLIRNAMDAMEETPEKERQLRIAIETGASELRISVTDQGCGIHPDIRDKLFSAFFTTKPEGMGVGLSICRSIIEFHRGRLWAEDNADSATGSGTIFIFTLPLEAT
ncbi:MAG: PAS domain-containing sensor histidine kinase [Betaproteobacteria bacterium HGW-Betaproteobacteria-7]|jgi:two-component system sensor histidine kinase DctS|nr:MAG: PAS domain-containing sensor histidine kinase [Betaproteobacteria bacterium HGW-Betaproteobacteria-7]